MGGIPYCAPMFTFIERTSNSCFYMIWIHNVLPPVVADPISASRNSGDMPEPPLVVFTDVAASPFRGCDRAGHAFEIGKVM